ncbi:SPOR domain-containing protein [Ectopseudomonas mendocina]|uniref:SPOR domain-containing protein n=1 Tax=Ectopseudomonas mendocina TaxID=300 RepID=A0ABZ2RJ59_ECTME
MRWMFLWLLVLNVFYYVWHQQQAPMRATEIAPLAMQPADRGDIKLLSESSASLRKPGAIKKEHEEAVCMFLGRFEEASQAAPLEQQLLSLGVGARVETLDAAAGVDYWVYMPPLASRQASLRQLRELQARKIDSYIIGQGELVNGISLGIFPRMAAAESVMERLRAAGYEPLLRELPRAHRSYWVQIEPESRRLADEALVSRLAFNFKGLEQQLMPCKGIATGH